jgi:hypothetical protein
LPVPFAPAEIVNQGSVLAALHEQLAGAATLTDPLPPDCAIDCD